MVARSRRTDMLLPQGILTRERSGQATDEERSDRLHRLEQRRAELRARLPRHSPPTAMLVELDEIEDELARLSDEQARSNEAGTIPA